MSTPKAPAKPLDNLQVAAPCQMSWNDMNGDERVRHCQQCKLNVYNISEMTKDEAEDLINKSEGRLCIRFYRRTDGTILTNNCPVGLRAIQRRLYAKLAAIFGAAFLSAMFITRYVGQSTQGAMVPLEPKLKVKVVLAVTNIPERSIIPAAALEEREVSSKELPADTIHDCSLAVGTIAKYGIVSGQIICRHDLEPKVAANHTKDPENSGK